MGSVVLVASIVTAQTKWDFVDRALKCTANDLLVATVEQSIAHAFFLTYKKKCVRVESWIKLNSDQTDKINTLVWYVIIFRGARYGS